MLVDYKKCTYVVPPRHSVHPRVGFYVAFEIYVHALLDSAAVDVTAEFQINDWHICGKNIFMGRLTTKRGK